MNEKDLLEVIGEATEEMLEKSEKRQKHRKRQFAVLAAACMAIVAMLTAVSFGYLGFQQDTSSYPRFHRVSAYKIAEVPEEPSEDGDSEELVSYIDVQKYGVSFEAKILRVFPDPYVVLDGVGSGMRIMEVQVVDAIVGENIPQIVYCFLTRKQAESVQQNQTIIYSGVQSGVEGTAFANTRTRNIELFGTLFSRGEIVFFENEKDPYIEKTKQRIQKLSASAAEEEEMLMYRIVVTAAKADEELAQALDEIANPGIGVFRQVAHFGQGEREFWCYRMIDRFMTDEMISIDLVTGKVTYKELLGGGKISAADRYTGIDRLFYPI